MTTNVRILRGARAILGWSQAEVAKKAGISENAVARMEAGQTDARSSTIRAVQRALEEGGIRFLEATDAEDEGLRLRKPKP